MSDIEQVVKELVEKELADIHLELTKLRWRTTTSEILFMMVCGFLFEKSVGISPHELSETLLQWLASFQKTGETHLHTSAEPEDQQKFLLEAFAQEMESLKESLSFFLDDPLQ
jgi:hypothetical protein